jgi:hypothetical protein
MPCFTRHGRHPRRLLWPKRGSGGAQPGSPIGPDVTRHRAPNKHLGMSIQPCQEARHGAVVKDRMPSGTPTGATSRSRADAATLALTWRAAASTRTATWCAPGTARSTTSGPAGWSGDRRGFSPGYPAWTLVTAAHPGAASRAGARDRARRRALHRWLSRLASISCHALPCFGCAPQTATVAAAHAERIRVAIQNRAIFMRQSNASVWLRKGDIRR